MHDRDQWRILFKQEMDMTMQLIVYDCKLHLSVYVAVWQLLKFF